LKDDILKSILETDEGDISRVLKEAKLEGEAAGILEAAAMRPKAYKDEVPDGALQILAKASGLPEPQPATEGHTKEEGAGRERKGRALLRRSSPKKPWRRWTRPPRPLSSSSKRRILPQKPRPGRPGRWPQS